MSFLKSIQTQSKKYDYPFDYWMYSGSLTDEAIEEIVKADIPDVNKYNLSYDGTRAIDGGAAEFREGIASGGQAIKFRCFVTKENEKQFPNLVKFINELQSKEVYQTISKMLNKDLSNSYVRVEVICDREGFWLKPHCDIKEKLMSGLIFINNANGGHSINITKLIIVGLIHTCFFLSSIPNTPSLPFVLGIESPNKLIIFSKIAVIMLVIPVILP